MRKFHRNSNGLTFKNVFFVYIRRRVLTSSSDEESQIDQQTEERIRLSATRNNLSSLEVKNILKVTATKNIGVVSYIF